MKNTLKQSARDATKDTGSSEAQVTLLTQRINTLTEHFKQHKKDYHSGRGLIRLVSKRKKLLKYLQARSPEIYQKTLQALSLRK